MTARLVILGLLRDQPLYGYEIKQIIEEHMSDWTSIAFGSIYFALDKLEKEKFIDKVGVEQDKKRPARSVFQINDKGREEFLRLLRENWQQAERQYFSLDVCLFFLNSLPSAEVTRYLHTQQSVLQTTLEHLQKHQAEQMSNPNVPRQALSIFDHTVVHTQAELNWVSSLIEKIESGEYS
ncbi:MAG: PadR family transcriptional regulator [Leptolinea sp.]|jgi:DNA-binding PadR family transcriptional regulator|nr:PadR family transcriptional regulator [Leptolinea sp.]